MDVIILPKVETLEIQDFIADLGRSFGFDVEKESSVLKKDKQYSPIADVVWYLDLSKYFKLESCSPLFEEKPIWLDLINRIPFAGFEIEGSTTSSKNQISNFANLYLSQCLFKFVIVNNTGAGKENDTYRRGIKINHYFQDLIGSKNIIFADWSHIVQSAKNVHYSEGETKVNKSSQIKVARGTFGGETASVKIYEKVLPYLLNSGLEIKQNYSPEQYSWDYFLKTYMYSLAKSDNQLFDFYFKKQGYIEPVKKEMRKLTKPSDSYYIPKIDVVAGFNVPIVFIKWLKAIGEQLENDVIHYPLLFSMIYNDLSSIFVPAISMEIETTVSKHLNGGIINMSRNSFVGILAAKKEAVSHLKTYRDYLGCANVLFYQWEE